LIANFQIILRILQYFKTISFVKYELKIKIVSNFGDGYMLKEIKRMFLTFFVIESGHRSKFSNLSNWKEEA